MPHAQMPSRVTGDSYLNPFPFSLSDLNRTGSESSLIEVGLTALTVLTALNALNAPDLLARKAVRNDLKR